MFRISPRLTNALLACCLLLPGCKTDSYDGPKLIPVDGIVTLDGQPLPAADLEFLPVGETRGQGAVGRTDAHGRFTLASHEGRTGAPEGTYRVVITKCELPGGTPCPEQADIPPMDSAARQVLPERYSSYSLTELTAVVVEGTPLEFHLTSTLDKREARLLRGR